MKKKIISIVIALFLTLTLAYSQQGTSRDIIFKAMKDELARNMSNLALENLKKSFFISDFTNMRKRYMWMKSFCRRKIFF